MKLTTRLLTCMSLALSFACGSDDITCLNAEGTTEPCAAEQSDPTDELELESEAAENDTRAAQPKALATYAKRHNGPAFDIGAGRANTNDVWMLGPGTMPDGGYEIRKWNGSSFGANPATGGKGAKRIAVSMTSGIPWIVGADDRVYARTSTSDTSGTWQQRGTQTAKDVATQATNNVGDPFAWIIGRDNNEIYQWTGTTWNNTDNGYGVRITVDGSGRPWIVASSGSVWRRTTDNANTGTWNQVIGSAQDIGGGRVPTLNGQPEVVVSAPDNSIWEWNSSGVFQEIGGYGVAVTADANGIVWVIASSGSVWQEQP